MGEVQVAVAQGIRVAPDLPAVVADGADIVLDHLLAARGARASHPSAAAIRASTAGITLGLSGESEV